MFHLKDSSLHSSVFSLVLTAFAVLVSLLLRPFLQPDFFLPFLVAVFASAWYYGPVGGFSASALCTVALGSLLVILREPWVPGGPNLAASLLSFIAIAVVATALISGFHSSRNMLTATLSSIADGVVATDRDERVTFLNPVAEALTGWRRADATGRPLNEVLHVIDESRRQPAGNPARDAIRARTTAHNTGHVLLVARDNTEIAIEQSAAPLLDERGRLQGAILVFRDITGRRQLEEQLSHARKMDAVGRLAGGVAGDFNNVLTVINGYSDMLRAQIPPASPLRRFADEILYAGERAAALTRQLLTFSSGQTSQPKACDLNSLIASMEPMLRRLLGDSVELIALPSPGLGLVQVDGSQMQQAIMNLATNARDAMPNGGKLVIETSNIDMDEAAAKKSGLKPGAYVMLAVSDTGCGMDAETRSRLFEPFFTTKEHGKGSGLGLSMVYGTVRQSEGQITVYSQVNCGTIFEIYLPRVEAGEVVHPVHRMAAAKGSETILLVDDEEGVRKLVSAVLNSGGYTVIEAANGSAALSIYEKNSHKIDLVLTDVVMPQMNGFELGVHLAERDTELPVLYMSGYRDSPMNSAPGEPIKAFLNKPFTPDTLLAKVREVLDAGDGLVSTIPSA
ncbi:MAG TPA: response regulator [Bryobacteraceae bacterium]|nr:response regulator [Bryobacteraceae bacterium]